MRQKILYNPPKSPSDKILISLMKKMAHNLTCGVDIEDLWSAQDMEGNSGLFCSTDNGGKIFWTFEELQELFIRKNNEWKRFRV